MHDDDGGTDCIREEQESDGPLEGSFEGFALRQTDEEEADGDFGPHEGCESLDPFAVSVFAELADFVVREELLVFAETVVDFDKVKSGADGCS